MNEIRLTTLGAERVPAFVDLLAAFQTQIDERLATVRTVLVVLSETRRALSRLAQEPSGTLLAVDPLTVVALAGSLLASLNVIIAVVAPDVHALVAVSLLRERLHLAVVAEPVIAFFEVIALRQFRIGEVPFIAGRALHLFLTRTGRAQPGCIEQATDTVLTVALLAVRATAHLLRTAVYGLIAAATVD